MKAPTLQREVPDNTPEVGASRLAAGIPAREAQAAAFCTLHCLLRDAMGQCGIAAIPPITGTEITTTKSRKGDAATREDAALVKAVSLPIFASLLNLNFQGGQTAAACLLFLFFLPFLLLLSKLTSFLSLLSPAASSTFPQVPLINPLLDCPIDLQVFTNNKLGVHCVFPAGKFQSVSPTANASPPSTINCPQNPALPCRNESLSSVDNRGHVLRPNAK